jgi:hypothetical protein
MRIWKHRAQFLIPSAARQRLPRAEEENKIGVAAIAGSIGPAGGVAPGQLSHAHGNFPPWDEAVLSANF